MEMEEGEARVRHSRGLELEVYPTGMSAKTLLLAGGKVRSSGILSRFPLTFPVFLKMGWTNLYGTDHMPGHTPSPGPSYVGQAAGSGEAWGTKGPAAAPRADKTPACLPSLIRWGLLPLQPTPLLLPVGLLCRHCLLLWREEGKVAKARLLVRVLPAHQEPPHGGGRTGPADPQGTPRKWPHRTFLTHHPTPNLPAPSCQPLCSACVNFFTWLASRPPSLCTTVKNLTVLSLL